MAIDRRQILLGSLAFAGARFAASPAGAADAAGAGTEAIAFVAAARRSDDSHVILLLSRDGTILREVPLSARGHDIALHAPSRRAVAFARRPGTFAVSFDLDGARPPMIFNAIEGRHFYGHGTFSRDGRLLYVSENDIAHARGVIGIYDVERGMTRIGEHASHGVGPHEIIMLGDGATLAVANGGIDTVPEAGREMLNLDQMRPNLAFVSAESGALLARHELTGDMNRLSIRHIAADSHGRVWFGGQWEGDLGAAPELIGRCGQDTPLELVTPETPLGAALKGYIGSVAASKDGSVIAASAPKAGSILYFAADSGALLGRSTLKDGCGIAGEGHDTFAVTSGLGAFRHEDATARLLGGSTLDGIAFDNHLRKV